VHITCCLFSTAPGSKTSQLLEIISNIPQGETEPKGYVVANDSDAKRAYMLVHQLRRLNSPATFVTAKDAQFWPMLLRGKNIKDEERAQEGMFDRVLCDVPCTGDGTARKNPGIWKHWTASAGHSIHPLQVSIALNGARLTKVGGYMCYSTCSMNPIENEAVVAEILRATDGSLELVDKRPGHARYSCETWLGTLESDG
jgi:tRNA and rRNA cytosine-C5-methylases